MAREDKDAAQKSMALRFLVSAGAIPWLEVPVSSAVDLSAQEKLLTDIDVLGLHCSSDGTIRRTLIDCKTKKMPPMERAFWLAGVMAYLRSDEGFVILSRRAEKAHRLTAKVIGVRLFESQSFIDYATAAAPSFSRLSSYACDAEAWFRFREQAPQAAQVLQLLKRTSAEVPLANDIARRLRRLVAAIREARGELDPAKDAHMAIFAETVLAMSILLVPLVGELRNLYDLSEDREELSSVLRFYVWGGRDGVAMFQRMADGDKRTLEDAEAAVLAWPQFIELIRGLLDEPTAVHHCCMPLRELALRYVADKSLDSDVRLGRLLLQPRARQFSRRIANYVVAVGKMPQDFARRLDHDIDALAESVEQAIKPAPNIASARITGT